MKATQAQFSFCCADGNWKLTAPAQAWIDCLKPCFHDESGKSIDHVQRGCFIVCSWAPRHRVPGHGPNVQLGSFCMPAADSLNDAHELKLYNQHSHKEAHVLKLNLQPVPKRLKGVSINKHQQNGRKACQLGKSVHFELQLNDDNGSVIPNPACWFKLHDPSVSLDRGEHLTCRAVNGEDWLYSFDLPATGLPVGNQQLTFTGRLEPLHWQEQLYQTNDPFGVKERFSMEIAAGPVARFRPKAECEVPQLSLLPIRLEALDVCGNLTNDVPKGLVLTACCEGVQAHLKQDASRIGVWQGTLCMAVVPGDYSISIEISAKDPRLAVDIPTPGPREISVTQAPFVSSVGLEITCSSGMVAGELLEALVTLIIAPEATRTLSTEDAQASSRIAIKQGNQEHELTFCSNNQPGLQFRFTGNLPCSAGPACIEATWKEHRQDLVAALKCAQEHIHLDLEPRNWQNPACQCQLEVRPGVMEALQLFPAELSETMAAHIGILRGESLPQLQAQVVDRHGNMGSMDAQNMTCTMHAKIWLHDDHAGADLRAPMLASEDGQAMYNLEFQADWNEEAAKLCLPLKATRLAHVQLGNSEAVIADYTVEVISEGPWLGLKGKIQFSFSDELCQKQEQEEAKRTEALHGPKDKEYREVRLTCNAMGSTPIPLRYKQSQPHQIVPSGFASASHIKQD